MASRILKPSVLVLALVVMAALAVGATAGAQSGGGGSSRTIQYFAKGPSEQCVPDPCGFKTISLGPVTMPADSSVDVTISLSFEYAMSGTNRSRLAVAYQSGQASGDLTPIYRVGSLGNGRRTSTSLTWFAKGLPGAGRTYRFTVEAFVGNAHTGSIETNRVIAVIEVTPG